MIWHAKREGDAGLQWLRGLVRDVAESRMMDMSEKTPPRRKRRIVPQRSTTT